MVWLLPAALTGLLAVAGPLIVHLLRRQRAKTVIVPTVRFVPSVDESVVRVRHPTDGWLLVLRMAIVACAAVALAQPLLMTRARATAWNERLARVVIVDVSESAGAASAAEAIAAELRTATFPRRIDAGDVAPALRRAIAWLQASPPARREIVVLSDFQRGVLESSDVDGIPEGIGIRFVPVGTRAPIAGRAVAAPPVMSEGGTLLRQVRLDDGSTGVIYSPASGQPEGLRLLTAPQDAEAAASLLRVVARAGVPAPSELQPIVVRFPGGEPLPPAAGAASGWATDAALRLLRAASTSGLSLTAATGDGALLVDVQAVPGTFAAAQALKAALDARADPRALAEQEIAQIPEQALRAWTRAPGVADTSAWRQSPDSDGRWLWLVALILLGIESFVRRSTVAPAPEVAARAA